MNWLDYVILLLSCVAELYICHDFFSGFFTRRDYFQNEKKCTGIFALFVFLQYGVNLVGSTTLNLLCIPALLLAYLALIYEAKTVQLIMLFVLALSVLLGCEFLVTVIAETTRKDNALYLSSMPWQTFTVKLLSFMILTIIKQAADKSRNKVTNKAFWLFFLIPAASLGMMFSTYFVSIELLDDWKVKLIFSFSSAFMLLGNLVVFTVFNRYAKDLYLSMQQSWMLSEERMNRQYYEKIADMNEERSAMIHDFKHYLSVLRALKQGEEDSEALRFLDELDIKLNGNELKVYCGIPFLDAILSEKEAYAERCGVQFYIEVEPVCSLDGIRKMDYVVMLGNLLDNAIQAAEKVEENPYVNVNIFTGNSGAFLITKISNSYKRENLVIKGEEFISSKKDEGIHGVGIKSVRRTAAECNGMFSTDIKDDIFTAALVLPCEAKEK